VGREEGLGEMKKWLISFIVFWVGFDAGAWTALIVGKPSDIAHCGY
jgi:hypothetical protein